MVRGSIFLFNIVWTFCASTNKSTLRCPVGFFCSRRECEKRKAIWDACVAAINADPAQKKDFDTQMLALTSAAGQYTQTD
jgi:hypothetical protein